MLVAAWATTAMLAGTAHAGARDLDATFSGDGRQLVDIGALDQAAAIALAPDGKIVVVGTRLAPARPSRDIAVVRLRRDGSLDKSFSGDGIQTTNISENDLAYGVAVGRDGRIVVVGESWELGTVLVRYATDGSLDPSFGTGGVQTAGFGPARDVAIQPDGRIVTAGGASAFAIARFNADGSPDLGFGAAGLSTAGAAANGGATSVALQPDGRIVAAGANMTGAGRGDLDIALIRLSANGSADMSFAGDGTLTAGQPGIDESANDLAVQRNGRIVAAGQVDLDGFRLFRWRRDGVPDATFAGDGSQTTNVSAGSDVARGVALQPGGQIVAVGGGKGFTLARFQSGGSLDTGFSEDGKLTMALNGGYNVAAGVAIAPDCKIVVAGEAGGDFAVARLKSACPAGYEPSGGTPEIVGPARTRLYGSRVQRLGRYVRVSASCHEDPCRVTVSGTIRMASLRLKAVSRTIARKGSRATIALRLGTAARAAIRRALRADRRVTVKLRVSFVQPGAMPRSLRRNVRLTL